MKKQTKFALFCGAILAVGLFLQGQGELNPYRAKYAKPISQWEKPKIDKSVENEWEEFAPLPKTAPFPADNPYHPKKRDLGEKLFNEVRLSASGQFSCASCHDKSLAYTDGKAKSTAHGGQSGRRSAPNIEMSGFFPLLFWDGRAEGLEAQALGPITDPVEMANTLSNAECAIKNAPEYYALFVAAFGDKDLQNEWQKIAPEAFSETTSEDYEKAVIAHLREDIKIISARSQKSEAQKEGESESHKNADSNKDSRDSSHNHAHNHGNSAPNAKDSAQKSSADSSKDSLQKSEQSLMATLSPRMKGEIFIQANAVFGNKHFYLPHENIIKDSRANRAESSAKKPSKSAISRAKKLITIENIAKAIATYERTLVPQDTRFNRFLKGDYAALSDKELFGLDIFRNKGECMNCHYGAILSDKKFHNIGLAFFGRELQDLGRYEVTKNPSDVGAFKTPSLIHTAKSAPYGHNGIMTNLMGVIHFYDMAFPFSDLARFPIAHNGAFIDISSDKLAPKLDPLIRRLNLTAEEYEALEAFLQTL